MIAELGRFLIALALIASLFQMVLCWLAANRKGEGVFAQSGKAATQMAVLASGFAFLLLIVSAARSDFSIAYIAANSHVDKPLFYKIAAAWGGHEGSLLLWCGILAAFGLALALKGPTDPALRMRAVSLQGVLQTLFFEFLVFASNPFERVAPAPLQGEGLNPILQDPMLAIHPPMLYLGYVGLSTAFAIAAAGLVQKTDGRSLAAALRPWALGAWSSLTAGIALGSWWAYYELGWGGWWFWDPVENASFMPWLLGAALIHSAIATEKRGAFPGWTVFLALLAYIFSILGAFLVRSGVITSVHAFALDPERGIWILAMFALTALAGFILFGVRVRHLGEGDGFAPTSRESFIGVNNLLLATSAGVVLVGTVYPLVLELVNGTRISVGAPYFNAAATPLMMMALMALPLAPFLPWGVGGAKAGLKTMRAVLCLVPCAVAGLVLLWNEGPIMAVLGGTLGVWVLTGASMDSVRSWPNAKTSSLKLALAGRSLAHAGVGFIALGASADAARPPNVNANLVEGASVSVAGRVLTLEDVKRADGPNYLADQALIRLDDAQKPNLKPERRFYPTANQNTREVALASGLTGDIYVSLGEARTAENGELSYEIRAAFHPLIWALGLGAVLIVLGGILALSARWFGTKVISEAL